MKTPSKGLRSQLVETYIHKYDHNDGTYSLSDILPKDVKIEDVSYIMIAWLNENCSNGHFSLWTSFGDSLWNEAKSFVRDLIHEYLKFDFGNKEELESILNLL